MMEIEKLKDNLNNAAGGPVGVQMCHEAADAIEQLQAENEKLKRALAEMWFAYENKDGAVPHDFEEQAVELAQEILGPWESVCRSICGVVRRRRANMETNYDCCTHYQTDEYDDGYVMFSFFPSRSAGIAAR